MGYFLKMDNRKFGMNEANQGVSLETDDIGSVQE